MLLSIILLVTFCIVSVSAQTQGMVCCSCNDQRSLFFVSGILTKLALSIHLLFFFNCLFRAVYGFGSTTSSQLTGIPTGGFLPNFVYSDGVLSGKTIKQVVAGAAHTVALTTDGSIVAFGSNDSGTFYNK